MHSWPIGQAGNNREFYWCGGGVISSGYNISLSYYLLKSLCSSCDLGCRILVDWVLASRKDSRTKDSG